MGAALFYVHQVIPAIMYTVSRLLAGNLIFFTLILLSGLLGVLQGQ